MNYQLPASSEPLGAQDNWIDSEIARNYLGEWAIYVFTRTLKTGRGEYSSSCNSDIRELYLSISYNPNRKPRGSSSRRSPRIIRRVSNKNGLLAVWYRSSAVDSFNPWHHHGHGPHRKPRPGNGQPNVSNSRHVAPGRTNGQPANTCTAVQF